MKPILSVIALCLVACFVEAHVGLEVNKDGSISASLAAPKIGGKCRKRTAADNSDTLTLIDYNFNLFCDDSDNDNSGSEEGKPGVLGTLFDMFDLENPAIMDGPSGGVSVKGSVSAGGIIDGLMDILTSKTGPIKGIMKLFDSLKSNPNMTLPAGPLANLLARLGSGDRDGVLGGLSGPKGLGGLLKALGSDSKGGILDILQSKSGPLAGLLKFLGSGGKGGILDILQSKSGPLAGLLKFLRSDGKGGILDILQSKSGPLAGLLKLLGSGGEGGILDILQSKSGPLAGLLKFLRSDGKGGILDILESKSGPLAGILKALRSPGLNVGVSVNGSVNASGNKGNIVTLLNRLSSGLFMRIMNILNRLLSPVFGIVSQATSKRITPKLIYDLTSGALGSPNGTMPGSRFPGFGLPRISVNVDAGIGKHNTKFGASIGGDDDDDN